MKTPARHCSTAFFSLFLICQPTGATQFFGFSLPAPDSLPADSAMIGAKGVGFEGYTKELPSPVSLNPLSEALNLNRYIEQSA